MSRVLRSSSRNSSHNEALAASATSLVRPVSRSSSVAGGTSLYSPQRTLAELYTLAGVGRFQVRLFIICGLGFMADSVEVGVISFLEHETTKLWHLRGFEKNALGTVVFIGELLGCLIWGPLADRVGRRSAFLYSNLTLLSLGILSAAAPSFWALVVIRGLVGIAIGGIVIPFDNLAESVPETYAVPLCFAIEFFWTLGTLWSTGAAAFILPASWGSWRWFVLATAFPIFLACLGYFVLEESPVWLQDVGKDDEAMKVLQRMAAANGKVITGATLLPYEREAQPAIRELFIREHRRPTVALSVLWILGFFGYYGASLASGKIFGHSRDFNYGELVFASSGEVMGVLFAMVATSFIGGMRVLAISYVVAAGCSLGIVCVSSWHGPDGHHVMLPLLAFVLRLGVMAGSSTLWVVTPAAFPTYIRATAHSVLFGMGRIGGLCATLWPESAPLELVMGTYAVANLLCAVVGFCEGHSLEDRGAFESLAADLNATDIERRVRCSDIRSRLSASIAASGPRPSEPRPDVLRAS